MTDIILLCLFPEYAVKQMGVRLEGGIKKKDDSKPYSKALKSRWA